MQQVRIFLFLFLSFFSTNIFSEENKSKFSESECFKNLLNSVVKIDVWEETQSDGSSILTRSIGSGVILSDDGHILTNAHVVNLYAKKIIVTLANLEKVGASLLGWDHWTDLAVIKLDMDDIKRRRLKFSHSRLGDSNELETGETVYAVGTPHGFARTVTRGIISNLERFFEGNVIDRGYEVGSFNTWIQTDAAINRGNSGGPLAISDGTVIGINTRKYLGAENLSFAVPSNIAKRVFADLKARGNVERSYIGISLDPIQDMENFFELDTNKGVLIRNVDVGSPAALEGIMSGDILLKINDNIVDGRFPEQIPGIMNYIAVLPVNSEVSLEILKNGKTRVYKLKTELLESRIGKEFPFEKWGVGVREITKVFARESKINEDSNLLVIGIRNGFPFDIGKVNVGDIITRIDGKLVRNIDELKVAYQNCIKSGGKIMVEVSRNHTITYCIIPQ